jgi:hypothetical protein
VDDKVESVLLARAIAVSQRFEIHRLKLGQSRAKHIFAITALGTEFSFQTTHFRGQVGKAKCGLHLTAFITGVRRHLRHYVHINPSFIVESISVSKNPILPAMAIVTPLACVERT